MKNLHAFFFHIHAAIVLLVHIHCQSISEASSVFFGWKISRTQRMLCFLIILIFQMWKWLPYHWANNDWKLKKFIIHFLHFQCKTGLSMDYVMNQEKFLHRVCAWANSDGIFSADIIWEGLGNLLYGICTPSIVQGRHLEYQLRILFSLLGSKVRLEVCNVSELFK